MSEGMLHLALPLADFQANTNTMRASAEFGGREVFTGLEETRTWPGRRFSLVTAISCTTTAGPHGDGYLRRSNSTSPEWPYLRPESAGHWPRQKTSSGTADEIFF